MARIRNVAGEPRDVPWLGRVVDDGEVVDVPEADVYAYTEQEMWEPADEAAQAAHDNGSAGARGDEPDPQVVEQGSDPAPPGDDPNLSADDDNDGQGV